MWACFKHLQGAKESDNNITKIIGYIKIYSSYFHKAFKHDSREGYP